MCSWERWQEENERKVGEKGERKETCRKEQTDWGCRGIAESFLCLVLKLFSGTIGMLVFFPEGPSYQVHIEFPVTIFCWLDKSVLWFNHTQIFQSISKKMFRKMCRSCSVNLFLLFWKIWDKLILHDPHIYHLSTLRMYKYFFLLDISYSESTSWFFF